MLVDTHSHINFKEFKDDTDEVIRRALDRETWMVVVGSEYKTSQRALNLANKYEKGVYAAVGLHPIHLEKQVARDKKWDYEFVTRAEEFNYDNYEKLAKFEKIVAIGEVGLDYFHINLDEDVGAIKKKQQDVFGQFLLLARSLDLPAIIHCRQAHDDMLSILKDFKKNYRELIPTNKPWAVMHCFSGDEDLAWKYFSLGLMISFTGMITFSKRWDDLIRKMPPDRLMIETDCPYMTPEPHRGERNEPALVQFVAKRIAEIRNLTPERVAEITTQNAREFFGI